MGEPCEHQDPLTPEQIAYEMIEIRERCGNDFARFKRNNDWLIDRIVNPACSSCRHIRAIRAQRKVA